MGGQVVEVVDFWTLTTWVHSLVPTSGVKVFQMIGIQSVSAIKLLNISFPFKSGSRNTAE
jgi:hypothetical protein